MIPIVLLTLFLSLITKSFLRLQDYCCDVIFQNPTLYSIAKPIIQLHSQQKHKSAFINDSFTASMAVTSTITLSWLSHLIFSYRFVEWFANFFFFSLILSGSVRCKTIRTFFFKIKFYEIMIWVRRYVMEIYYVYGNND